MDLAQGRRALVIATIVAQPIFVLSWLVARLWQRPAYDAVTDSISDMYAVTAPHGWFLVMVLTLCGALVIAFAALVVWPVLGRAGWPGRVGSVLLALSVLALGDLLSPWERLACQRAEPGCSADDQLANAGGKADATLTTLGLFVLVAAGFFLAAALGRAGASATLVRATYGLSGLLLVLIVLAGATSNAGPGGLFERLAAAEAAALVAVVGVALVRTGPTPE